MTATALLAPHGRRLGVRKRWVAIGVAVLGSLAGAGTAISPFVTMAALAAMLFVLILLNQPDVGTVAVVAVIFSNAAVLATKFHQVPSWVAALVPLLLAVPLAHIICTQRRGFLIVRPAVWLGGFLVVQILGTLLSADPDVSRADLATFATEGFLLYLLITNVVRSVDVMRRAAWALVVVAALLGALSFYQEVTKTYSSNYGGFSQMSQAAFGGNAPGASKTRRHAGPIGEQNRWAQSLAMVLPLAVALAASDRRKKLRLVALLAIGGILLGIAMTYSRGAVVGVALTLLFAVAVRWVRVRHAVIGAVLVVVAISIAAPSYISRASTVTDVAASAQTNNVSAQPGQVDSSFQSRAAEGTAAALAFIDHPVFGVGTGLFPSYYQSYARTLGLRVVGVQRQAHSLYLGVAAENGAFGLVTFGGVVVSTLRMLARARKHALASRPDLAALCTGWALGLFTYMTTGIFLHFAYIRYFWLFAALAAAAARVVDKEVREAEAQPTVDLPELDAPDAPVPATV